MDQDLPKMKPSADEVELRKRQLQQKKVAAQRAARAQQLQAAAAVQAAPPAKQTLAIAALVFALAAAGFAGFLFMQLQTATAQFEAMQKSLASQSKIVDGLNQKLSASDENSNLSSDALKVLLREHDKEIRKLWDLVNKKNKPAIDKQGRSIASLQKTVKGLSSSTTKSIKGNTSGLASVRQNLASEIKSLQRKIVEVEASVNGLPVETEQRIAANEESIKSINATRQKLNQSTSSVASQFNDMKLEIEDINITLERLKQGM